MLDACAAIRERVTEIKGLGPASQYGLFLADDDPKKGVWLEPGRTLEHYLLRDQVRETFISRRFFSINTAPDVPSTQTVRWESRKPLPEARVRR